ncbi:MAG: abortive infection family protein [Acidobacteria bacterium]|nr:abortive infection family protein [Acidobacteriota bacterium]
MEKIPGPVAHVVGEVLGAYYYSHRRLNSLFIEKGAPGEPPVGNCADKCRLWLKRVSADASVDAFGVLGGVLEKLMEVDRTWDESQPKHRERITQILGRHGLRYEQGGRIAGAAVAMPTRTLQAILKARDLPALEVEVERARQSVETDPPACITACCSILEALCKVFIDDEGLPMPAKQTIKPLWKVVQDHLGLDPGRVEDDDISHILSGMTSVVDGIGSLRTHASSAHGRGRRQYTMLARHARLVLHAAHTLAVFVIETWDERKSKQAKVEKAV